MPYNYADQNLRAIDRLQRAGARSSDTEGCISVMCELTPDGVQLVAKSMPCTGVHITRTHTVSWSELRRDETDPLKLATDRLVLEVRNAGD